jgi:hypothetical protein
MRDGFIFFFGEGLGRTPASVTQITALYCVHKSGEPKFARIGRLVRADILSRRGSLDGALLTGNGTHRTAVAS